MTRVLVLGASGQIGRFALPRLRAAGFEVWAASRQPRATPGVRWCPLDLEAPPTAASLPRLDAMLSAGPLDLAARWLTVGAPDVARVVAFGSTSAASKHDAPDPAERELAERLLAAERSLLDWGDGRGIPVTLLRPTLVYGAGLDRNLSRLASLARRVGFVALPRGADGLRQPVHADDLAAAAVAAMQQPSTPRPRYDLPGGETLRYRSMVERVLDCLRPRPRLLTLPMPVLRAALAAVHASGNLRDARASMLLRMRQDLVFDVAPAREDLGYAPRRFLPEATMLGTGP